MILRLFPHLLGNLKQKNLGGLFSKCNMFKSFFITLCLSSVMAIVSCGKDNTIDGNQSMERNLGNEFRDDIRALQVIVTQNNSNLQLHQFYDQIYWVFEPYLNSLKHPNRFISDERRQSLTERIEELTKCVRSFKSSDDTITSTCAVLANSITPEGERDRNTYRAGLQMGQSIANEVNFEQFWDDVSDYYQDSE